MTPEKLLEALPPFRFNRDIVVQRQTSKHIILQVLHAHDLTMKDYDLIAGQFAGGDVPKKIFDWCRKYLRYNEEPGKDQTTRTPAGIIITANQIGGGSPTSFNTVDCKHYAGFIAGILDSLNRQGLGNYDWSYRFVSYPIPGKDEKEPDHVYVVLGDSDTWIDPAPLKDVSTGKYYDRYFDDRLAIPSKYLDIKNIEMLSHLSGVHYTVSDTENGVQCGCSDTMGTAEDDNVLEAIVTGLKNTAKQLADLLPSGGLKDWLNSFIDNPGKAIISLVKGRKYASQDYALGEIFMRNILGMTEIQSRKQVPDEYVPLASQFFTLALGVEVGSADHLDALVKSADAYYQWMPVDVDNATPRANAERASKILQRFNYGVTTRNITWPLDWFAAIPYVYPIPDIEPGSLFTGTHPITKEQIVQGFPVSPIPTDLPPNDLPFPNNPTPEPNPDADNKGKNLLLIGGLILGGILLLGKKKKK